MSTELLINNTKTLGTIIRDRRVAMGLRQQDLALTANVGVRFIVDIENGKETCQVGLTLRLLNALDIHLCAHSEPITAPTGDPASEMGIDDVEAIEGLKP